MELTDMQMYALLERAIHLDLCVTHLERLTRDELEQLELIEWNQHPRETGIDSTGSWELTELGHEVLQQHIVQALLVVDADYILVAAARRYCMRLTMERLPPLLVHENDFLRDCAKERMEELTCLLSNRC